MNALTLEHEIEGPSGRKQAQDRPPTPGASRGVLPSVQAPELCAIADEPPSGAGWLSEIKLDGYRLLASIDSGRVRLLTIDDTDGLVAMAQMSAIELHTWGAAETHPAHPDHLVFDLDPGEGVPFVEVVGSAHEVRNRLHRLGLESFCRTTGGKGLHIVVPLLHQADWEQVKPFCRAFAEAMSEEFPDRYLAHLKIADRRGRILVDWLRNGWGQQRSRPSVHVRVQVRQLQRRLRGAKSHRNSTLQHLR